MAAYTPTLGDLLILERETGGRHGFSRSGLLRVVRATAKAVLIEQSDARGRPTARLPLSALSDEGEWIGRNKVLHVAPWLVARADDRQQLIIGLAA